MSDRVDAFARALDAFGFESGYKVHALSRRHRAGYGLPHSAYASATSGKAISASLRVKSVISGFFGLPLEKMGTCRRGKAGRQKRPCGRQRLDGRQVTLVRRFSLL